MQTLQQNVEIDGVEGCRQVTTNQDIRVSTIAGVQKLRQDLEDGGFCRMTWSETRLHGWKEAGRR